MTDEERMDSFVPFTPVPVKWRRDGWFPERQRAFIRHLLVYGNIKLASEMVGMSQASAHKLRKRDGAETFSQAWDTALDLHQEYRATQRQQAYQTRVRKRASSLTRKITNVDKANTQQYYESQGYSGKPGPKFSRTGYGA